MIATTETRETLSSALVRQWEQIGDKLRKLAEEVPEKFYDAEAVSGLRTFADVLRHVAFWNQYVTDSVRGNKADDTANELPRAEYATKAQLLAEVERSMTDATDALKHSPSELNPAIGEMVMSFIGHNSEHYGQLAVYAQIHGIVPPASR